MNHDDRSGHGHTLLIFKHRHTAEKALHALVDAGVSADRISVFAQATPAHGVSEDELEHALNAGGVAGASLGAIAGFGLFAIPGIGPLLGTGPIAAGLTGAISGGSLGGVAGALAGAGLSRAEAAIAEHHVRDGKAVLIVRSEDDGPRIAAIARAQGAVEVAGA